MDVMHELFLKQPLKVFNIIVTGLGSMRPADLICHRVQLVQLQLYPAHSSGECTCSLTNMLTLMQGARLTGHEVIVSRNN